MNLRNMFMILVTLFCAFSADAKMTADQDNRINVLATTDSITKVVAELVAALYAPIPTSPEGLLLAQQTAVEIVVAAAIRFPDQIQQILNAARNAIPLGVPERDVILFLLRNQVRQLQPNTLRSANTPISPN